MTPEERAKRILGSVPFLLRGVGFNRWALERAVIAAIREAVELEREACAFAAMTSIHTMMLYGHNIDPYTVAAEIRGRSQAGPE